MKKATLYIYNKEHKLVNTLEIKNAYKTLLQLYILKYETKTKDIYFKNKDINLWQNVINVEVYQYFTYPSGEYMGYYHYVFKGLEI